MNHYFRDNKRIPKGRRNRIGQVAGQVFIYMMAVIIIGGIALVGYNAIKKLFVKSCEAEKLSFKSNIEELAEKYTSYGSVNKKSLKAPCDYSTICFVSASDIGSTSFTCNNGIIMNSVRNGVSQDIFAVSDGKTIAIGYSDLIIVDTGAPAGGCLCINEKSGNFNIMFSGRGSGVGLSEYTP